MYVRLNFITVQILLREIVQAMIIVYWVNWNSDKMMSVNCQDSLLHMNKYKNVPQRNGFTPTNKIKMGKTNTVILWCGVRRNSRVSGLGLMSYPSGFVTCDFSLIGCQPLAQTPTWRTRYRYLWPPEPRWPRYTPRHWVARVLGSATSRTHNNCETLEEG